MPLVTPEAPGRSIDALGAMLSTLAGSAGLKRAAPHFAARIMASPHELRAPGLSYRIYMLGLDDVAAGKRPAQARLFGWRHEFTNENEVVAADVTAGRQHRFAALNVGSPAQSVQRELRSAAFVASSFGQQSYAVALLQIPALAVRALWLKSRSRSREDIVVPLAPVRPELTAHHRYTPAEFIDAIRPAARSILAAEAPGKGG